MKNPAQTTHEAVTAKRSVMMHSHSAADGHGVRNVNVTSKHGSIGHDQLVTDLAIMGNMNASHQKTPITQLGDPIFFFARPIDRDALADRIVITDQDTRSTAAVTDVLRFTADHRPRMNMVVVPHNDTTFDHHVALEFCIIANLYVRPDVTERTDLDIVPEFRSRVDASEV